MRERRGELTEEISLAGAPRPDVDLTPFVPRLVPRWVQEAPGHRHRAISGTLVFIDLSGFTAMSEKLAGLGKVGAEELTHHLDNTFTELVSVSGGLGGTMLKFGGDALLIFFWGDDHEARAARAAVEMQETLDRIGTITTGAGEFRLRMTVGAHSGPVDFFLVGASHRELVVCGPHASAAVAVEGRAESGEIRLSPELAQRLDPSVVDSSCSPPLLVRAPEVEAGSTEWPVWPVGSGPSQFVPEMLRNHLSSGVELHEHKQMSVGFIHLSNLDELLGGVGPEVTGQHLDDLLAHVQRTLAVHGVAFVSTDVYEGGPKIICASGAVRTFGNDEESLLRSLREILDYPSAIELRVGLNRGHGFCGYVGPSFRRTFVTIGDVVNTAARIMSKAGPGEMLASGAVLERSETVFDTAELDAFAAKGKSEPLVAHRVGEVIGTRGRHDRPRLLLVGRDEELARLRSALADVMQGGGRFLELVGETGSGKSRLISEAAVGSGLEISEARCGRYAGSTPYFPFRTLLGDLTGGMTLEELTRRIEERTPALAPFAGLLALPLGGRAAPVPATEGMSPADQRAKVHEVVAELVRSLSTRPRIWMVEDAHWIDAASAELLRHLASVEDSLPLLILVGRRPADEGSLGAPGQIIELGPLSDEAAHELLQAASAAHLLPRELERLTVRSHGNPYFIIELAEAVSTDRDLEQLPDSLEALVAAKIDALPPADRLVLRQLAVIGSRFDPRVVREAVDDLPGAIDQRWERLDEFLDRSEVPWRFRQGLVRDTAYESLSYRERRDVHGRAGAAIEQHADDPESVCELLSLHFHEAGDHERSLRYSSQAADRAQRSFALAEATTFLERRVEDARRLEDREELGDALSGLAKVDLGQGHYSRSRSSFEEAIAVRRSLGNDSGVAAALSGLGTVARNVGEYERAVELFEESLEILKRLDDGPRVASVLRNIGTVGWLRGDYERARRRFEESLEVFESEGDRSEIAASLQTLGSLAFVTGDLDHARARYEESLRIVREQGDKPAVAVALLNLGNVGFQQGELAGARSYYEESLAIRRELGDRYGVSSALGNLGTVAYFSKDFAAARASYEESLGIAREIGDIRGVSQNLHNLGEIAIVEGDKVAARDLCREALELRRQLGDQRGVAESLTTLGSLAIDLDDATGARSIFLEALGLLTELGNKPGLAECLDAVAVIAATHDPSCGATLLGAVDGILTAAGSARTWSGDRRETLERTLRTELGEASFEEAFSEGSSMSEGAAVELARTLLRATAPAD